jgi:predicted small lipoprotein YifL
MFLSATQRITRAVMIVFIASSLSLMGCGNKGPLVQPTQHEELKKSQ